MGTLLRKECLEHGWWFAVIVPLSIVGYLMTLASIWLGETASPLESIRYFAVTFLIVVEVVLCNRLVVQEYSGKTQLFLESLPISRVTMLATKYAFGFAITLATLGGCFIIGIMAAYRSQSFESTFLAILFFRSFVFAFCTFSFFFMMGMLGRYRIAIYLLLVIIAFAVDTKTEFDSTVTGPFALMNERFAYEREVFPVGNLTLCSIAGLTFVGMTAALGMVREGSVAGLMAERMSYREKVFIAGILVGSLIGISVVDKKSQPDPYNLLNSETVSGDDLWVQVERRDDDPASELLAKAIHRDLVGIAKELNIQNRPATFLTHRSDLDADRIEVGRLENASGVLLRANFSSADFSYNSLRPILIDVWLSRSTNYNAVAESRCWVLEGYSEFWPRRGMPPKDGLGPNDWHRDWSVDRRAAYAGRVGFTPDDVDDWYTYRERIGQPILRSVGCAGLVLAERMHGREKLNRFLIAILGRDQPADIRSDIHRWINPIDLVWRETMGSDYDKFKQAWADELRDLGTQWSATLETVPRLSATADWEIISGTTRRLIIKPTIIGGEIPNELSVRSEQLDIFDMWQDDDLANVQTDPWQPGDLVTLRRPSARGDRMRWTVVAESSVLACDVISGWHREEVP